jgi:transcriptional regulator with XRE-family HTH domain
MRSPIDIARDLRRWMLRTGTTQAAVARKLGITQPHVSQILAGQFGPNAGAMRRFCQLAKVPLTGGPGRKVSPDAERTFIAAFLELWDGTEAGRRRAESLIRSVTEVLGPKEPTEMP